MNGKRLLVVVLSLVVAVGMGTAGTASGAASGTQDEAVTAGDSVEIADPGSLSTLPVGWPPVLVGLAEIVGFVAVAIVGVVLLVAYWRRPKLTFSVENPRGQEVEFVVESDHELDEFVLKVGGPESALIHSGEFTHSEEGETHRYTTTYVGRSGGRYAGTLTVGSTTPREGDSYRDSVGVSSRDDGTEGTT